MSNSLYEYNGTVHTTPLLDFPTWKVILLRGSLYDFPGLEQGGMGPDGPLSSGAVLRETLFYDNLPRRFFYDATDNRRVCEAGLIHPLHQVTRLFFGQ